MKLRSKHPQIREYSVTIYSIDIFETEKTREPNLMLRKLSKLDMTSYLCLIVIAISYIHHTEAQSCDAFSGPDGARLCVKVDGYDDYQWVTCRTDDYLRTTSGGRHRCLFHFIHEFCLLGLIQLIQLRLTSTIVKWQMCNMHERKKMMVIIWF